MSTGGLLRTVSNRKLLDFVFSNFKTSFDVEAKNCHSGQGLWLKVEIILGLPSEKSSHGVLYKYFQFCIIILIVGCEMGIT